MIKQVYFIFFYLFEIFIREKILILCFEFHKSILFHLFYLFDSFIFFLYKKIHTILLQNSEKVFLQKLFANGTILTKNFHYFTGFDKLIIIFLLI